MFTTKSGHLLTIAKEEIFPTDIEFKNFVQTFRSFKDNILFSTAEDVVEYFFNISPNIETIIRYLIICIIAKHISPYAKSVFDVFDSIIFKVIDRNILKENIKYVMDSNKFEEKDSLIDEYLNLLENV